MKTDSTVFAELTWPQVHAFRLERHHLTLRAPKKALSQVVGEIGGVQAQVMSAAELQVGVRVDCSVSELASLRKLLRSAMRSAVGAKQAESVHRKRTAGVKRAESGWSQELARTTASRPSKRS